ncbi:MAG TPA: prepilin peptidase, partial [Anaerolineae bacterium]|nr:prepilin peptidase [Anaerolineae bacterium]
MGNGFDLGLSVVALITTLLLAVIAWIDWRTWRIPDTCTATLLIWAGVQLLWPGRLHLGEALAGLIIGGGGFSLLAWLGRGGLGWGDVKFAA